MPYFHILLQKVAEKQKRIVGLHQSDNEIDVDLAKKKCAKFMQNFDFLFWET